MSCLNEKNSILDTELGQYLTDDAFIQYLIDKLNLEGIGKTKDIILLEGNKIKITDTSNSNKDEFTIAYFDAINPQVAANESPKVFENGVVINAGDVTITGSFTRQTYQLKLVDFQGVQGINDFNETELLALNLVVGQSYNFPAGITNSTQLTGTQSAIGSIQVEDKSGLKASETLSIIRKPRWYAGVTNDQNLNNLDVKGTYTSTGLGNPPSTIEFNVGNGLYAWVAFVSSVQIKDPLLGLDQVEDRITKSVTPVVNYTVDYQVQRTGIKSGGNVKFNIV